MKVRLTGDMTGNRNGEPWPERGSVVEVSDEEGAALCRGGMAKPVTDDKTEKATAKDDSEKRTDSTSAVTKKDLKA